MEWLCVLGPRSTPFFNDSCSDTETAVDMEGLLQSRSDNKRFIRVKEEIENETGYFKCNNNNPLHQFQGTSELLLYVVKWLHFCWCVGERRMENYMEIPFPGVLDSGQQNMFLTPPMAHQNGIQTLNPIDRLYSMQNSYFCGEDEQMAEH